MDNPFKLTPRERSEVLRAFFLIPATVVAIALLLRLIIP